MFEKGLIFMSPAEGPKESVAEDEAKAPADSQETADAMNPGPDLPPGIELPDGAEYVDDYSTLPKGCRGVLEQAKAQFLDQQNEANPTKINDAGLVHVDYPDGKTYTLVFDSHQNIGIYKS